MKYACGNEVIEGDTVERINDSLSLAVGEIYTVYVPSLAYGYIGIKEIIGPITYDPSYFKLIKRKEKEMLQRDQEYDVRLTGEEVAIVTMMLAVTSCNVTTKQGDLALSAYKKFKEVSGGFERYGLVLPSILLGSHTYVLSTWIDKVFTAPETEDQRKLRELKEKHIELGKAIEAMEKK